MLKEYLVSCNKDEIALSFEEIENIIGTPLCKSAYSYKAYWNSSATYIMPNTIIDAGYIIADVDLIGKKIEVQKSK